MLAPLTTHSTYNWDLVCFVAGNCLFRVPRQPFLACSDTFVATYSLSCDKWSPGTDGYTADKPIHLPVSVSETEFESLLKLVLPSLTTSTEVTLSKQQWLDVLKLSTLFEFNDFRRLAITKLDSQLQSAAEERISLARQHHISAWLVSGYAALVNQPEPIRPKQAHDIGLLEAVHLYMIREAKHKSALLKSSGATNLNSSLMRTPTHHRNSLSESTMSSTKAFDCTAHIEKSFADDLKAMREHELKYATKIERAVEERRVATSVRQQLKAKIEADRKRLEADELEMESRRRALRKAEQRFKGGIPATSSDSE